MDQDLDLFLKRLDRRAFIKYGLAAGSSLSLAALIEACGGGSSNPEAQASTTPLTGEPIIIGSPQGLSGGNQNDAIAFTVGAQLAAQDINDAGGLLGGRPLKVVSQDDGFNADGATAAFKQLVQGGAVAISGGTGSAECLAMMTLANSMKIPFVACGGAADAITVPVQPYTWRLITMSSHVVKVLFNMAKARGYKKIGVYSVSDQSFGATLISYTKQHAADYGMTVVDAEGVATGTTNATVQVSKLRAAKPDAVFIWGQNNDHLAYFNAVFAAGWKIPTIGTAGPGLVVAEQVYPNGSEGAEFFTTVDWTRSSNNAILQKSIHRFGPNKFNYEDGSLWVGYDSVALIAAGIKAANSTSGPAVRDAMEALKDFPMHIGPSGFKVTFSASNHQALGDLQDVPIIMGGDGKFAPKPFPVTQDALTNAGADASA